MKEILFTIPLILLLLSSCKKTKVDTIDTCSYDACDSRRKTVSVAIDMVGQLGYFNDIRKWAANVHVAGTYDSTLVCIFCTNIPDSLKTIGRTVTFSGDIKEGCGYPKISFFGQGIFYITQIKLK